jgi:hypothetical protein
MRSLPRWGAVAAATALLLLLPWLVAHRPVPTRSISAVTLLDRIQHSGDVGYSGYAESSGQLALPATDQFSSLTNLFGATTDVRVWSRSPLDWRVDTVTFAGEDDLYRDSDGYWAWNYERREATRTDVSDDPAVRLPRAGDLVPAQLAVRLLSQATAAEVTRLSVTRVAGVDAVGLRLRPSSPATSIDHVDVWADESSGAGLRVEVYAKGSTRAAITSSFLDYSGSRPAAATTTFVPPAAARVSVSSQLDLLSAGRAVPPVSPPTRLAGLAVNSATTTGNTSVVAYGRGTTELIAVPLRRRFTGQLDDQLMKAGALVKGNRVSLGVGPLNLLLLTGANGNNWLLSGTVTAATLATAADQLTSNPPGRQ